MWNGKKKAVTFSFDDGVEQDIRLIEILDRYGLRCTFNLNSGSFGEQRTLVVAGKEVAHHRLTAAQARSVYQNHEVAAHTRTHPGLYDLSQEELIGECEGDRLALQELFGQIKSKRYTLARIRRLVLSAFLGLETPLPDLPPYLKVLAANPLGLSLLKQTDLPVIVNHQDTKDLSTQAKQVYEEECRADDLYTILQPVVGPCGMNQQVNFRFPL